MLIIGIQSHIVLLYIIIIVPTFNVTPSNFYVMEATHSERCTLEDLYSYFYYYYSISIAIIHITITLISIIIITIIIIIYYYYYYYYYYVLLLLLLVVVERINYSVSDMMAGMSH